MGLVSLPEESCAADPSHLGDVPPAGTGHSPAVVSLQVKLGRSGQQLPRIVLLRAGSYARLVCGATGELKAQRQETGSSALTGTRYWWLQDEERRAGWSAERAQRFEQLLAMVEWVGQARKLKDWARSLWRSGPREQAGADWNRRIGLVRRSGLPAMARAAETIRRPCGAC